MIDLALVMGVVTQYPSAEHRRDLACRTVAQYAYHSGNLRTYRSPGWAT